MFLLLLTLSQTQLIGLHGWNHAHLRRTVLAVASHHGLCLKIVFFFQSAGILTWKINHKNLGVSHFPDKPISWSPCSNIFKWPYASGVLVPIFRPTNKNFTDDSLRSNKHVINVWLACSRGNENNSRRAKWLGSPWTNTAYLALSTRDPMMNHHFFLDKASFFEPTVSTPDLSRSLQHFKIQLLDGVSTFEEDLALLATSSDRFQGVLGPKEVIFLWISSHSTREVGNYSKLRSHVRWWIDAIWFMVIHPTVYCKSFQSIYWR